MVLSVKKLIKSMKSGDFMKIKRITSLLCIIAMMFMLLPVMNLGEVSAARNSNVWSNWTKSGDVVVENGVLKLGSQTGETGNATKAFNMSNALTVKFTARILAESSSFGIQIFTGDYRGGMYMGLNRINPFSSVSGSVNYALGNDWHDFRIEIDCVAETGKYYVDDVLVITKPLGLNGTAPSIKFWAGAGAVLEVEDFQIWNHDGTSLATSATHKTPEEYTPAFEDDWKENTGNWKLYDGPEVVWNKEKGQIDIDVVDGSKNIYYSIEQDVKTPENYDFEFDLNVRESVGAVPNFAARGGGHQQYIHFNGHKITTNPKDQNGLQFGFMIPVNFGEWHHITMSKRGDFMTIKLDNGECHTMELLKSTESTYFRINGTGASSAICRLSIGKVKYTPYFCDVDMEKPFNRSEYTVGSVITLKATPTEDVEYLDYYVNGVFVGKGLRENDYEYELKNTKVGAYTVSAGIGDKKSVSTQFFVRSVYDGDIELSHDIINLGEETVVRVCEEDIVDTYPISKVEYYVDNVLTGEVSSAPYAFNLKNLDVGTHSVHGKIINTNGAYFVTEALPVVVNAKDNRNVQVDREYELNYDLNSSDGQVNVDDGYFTLDVKHTASELKYTTDSGVMTHSVGKGKYKIVVTSGIADVYYNNQFSFSFRMPQVTGERKVSYSGIDNFVIGGSGVKVTYISEKWQGDAEYDKSFNDLGTRHAISFSPQDTISEMSRRDNLVNYSLEFDKTDISDEVIEYWDGEYYIPLKFKNGKIYTRTQESMINQIDVIDYELEGEVTPGYYRLTVYRGKAQLFCNNKWLGSFAAPIEASRIRLKRTMTNPTASTIVEVKGTDDRYYHYDNFEGETEIAPGDYWVEEGETKGTLVKEGNNSYMKIGGQGKYYLNTFTQNSHVKFRANIEKGAAFNFFTKYNTIYYINRLGYDPENSCWYSQQYALNRDPETDIGWSKERFTTPGTFEYGKWHDFEIITDEFTVEIKCDGQTVFKHDDIYSTSRGAIGFEVKSGTILFDDFDYVGEGKTSAGFISVVDNDGAAYHDFLMYSEDELRISGSRGDRLSTDGGKTWGPITAAKNNANIVKLQSGRIVKANLANLRYTATVSDDNGATWRTAGVITERIPGYRTALNGAIFQAKNGRIWFTTDEAGSENFGINGVFYSDDEGETWKESETLMDTRNHGVNIQEIRIVDMPEEGRVRMYGRSWRGFVQYVESTDNGVTFDQNWHHSEFLAAMCTYCVVRDNSEEQTYYALYNYDCESVWSGRFSSPRNRLILAVSYDGCKTWEFAADIINFGDFPQGVHRNHTMDIIGDRIYIGYTGANVESVLYTIDKTKLRTSKRMAECVERIFVGARTDEFSENYSVISKTTGKAKIYDNTYDVTVADGRMNVEAMARAMGVGYTVNGDEIAFTMGDGIVKFTEGATTCIVNGEIKDMGKIIMQNGLLDIKIVAEIYSRPVYESDNSWTIYFDNMFNKWYAEEIANLV